MTKHQSEPNAQPASEARVVSKPGAAIKVTQIPIPPDVQREIARGLELGTKAAETLGGPPRLAASDDPPWESLSRQAELRRESLVEKFKKIYEAGGKAWEGVITGRDANGVCQVCGAEGRELHREECPVVSRRYADLELTNHDSNSGTLDGTGHLLIAPPASKPSGREESLNSLEDRLAADIRAIDGNHDKGAAELAEQLIARGWLSQSATLEASHTSLQAKLDGVAGLVEKWRATSEASERRACIGHFPEGYSAEARAYEDCADELAAALAE
jgi:hypothetical protein